MIPGGRGGTSDSFLTMGLEYLVMDPFNRQKDSYLVVLSVFQENTPLSLAFFAFIQVVPGLGVTNTHDDRQAGNG